MRTALALAILLALVVAVRAARDDTHRIQAALEALAEREDALGLGISVRLADGRRFRVAAGHEDPSRRAPYDGARTAQVIGSVTKLYTAVLIMQLVEEGRVDLDGAIDRWVTFPGAETITVRMLLAHSSGLPDYLPGMTHEQLGRRWAPEELLARATAQGRVGAGVYSNTNALLLARIVEVETKETWEQSVAERITRPLGLERTGYAAARRADLAGGWMRAGDRWVDTTGIVDPSVGWGAGALVATNDELMRFTEALFRGELFEDTATLAKMLRFDTVMDPQYLGQEPPQRVGLGVIRMQIEGVTLDGHLGHAPGFNAGAVRDPETGAIIVVTSNDDRARAGYIALRVAHLVRDRRW